MMPETAISTPSVDAVIRIVVIQTRFSWRPIAIIIKKGGSKSWLFRCSNDSVYCTYTWLLCLIKQPSMSACHFCSEEQV
jgi:hypothetical protein